MRLTDALARSIHTKLGTVLEERARFLKELYDQLTSGPPVKERYLDVGAGMGINTRVFAEGFQEVYGIDIKPRDWGAEGLGIQFSVGDAQALPMEDASFDLLTMFSLIEHLPDPQRGVTEAVRVLRRHGQLVIQVPNPLFPVDLHTGLPNPFLVPKFARSTFLKMMRYPSWWAGDVYSHPRRKALARWMAGKMRLVGRAKIVYPASFVPQRVRPVYKLLVKAGFFTLIPPSYLCVYERI